MIHKYLIINKTLFLSSAKLEDQKTSKVIELLVPIQIHWDIVELLKQANFLLSRGGLNVDVQAIYRKIYRAASPYAVSENDRLWLISNINQAS